MKPIDFYRFGLAIASSADEESEHRTAVGRLYYGLHHEACCRYFRENPDGTPLGRGSRHVELVRRFDTNDAVSNKVGVLLKELSQMRNIADYELGVLIQYRQWRIGSCELLGMALIVARDLLDALETYSPGEAPDGCDCPTVYSSR